MKVQMLGGWQQDGQLVQPEGRKQQKVLHGRQVGLLRAEGLNLRKVKTLLYCVHQRGEGDWM